MAFDGAIVESIPNEFDYFEPKKVQAVVQDEFDRCVHPIAAPTHGNPIEFEIRSGPNLYLDLNKTKLAIRARIVNPDGSNIANDAAVGPVNLALHSLFSRVEMKLCDRDIHHQNTLYPYRAFLETLLTFTDDVAKTRLLVEGWKRDTSGHFDDFRVSADGRNTGYKERQTAWQVSAPVYLIGRLHADLFHQHLTIPPGCPVRLRLIPAPDAFPLKKPAANANLYKIQIDEAKLWVHTKEVSANFALAQEAMLRDHNIRIPFTKTEMKTLTIPTGTTSIEFDGVYSGLLPERVLVGMVSDQRVTGHWNHSPFVFQHFDLSSIVLNVNGENLPRIAYQPNFTAGSAEYIREYLGLLEGLGIDTANKSLALTPTEWATDYPLFIFRISPGGLPSLPKSGAANLSLKFRIQTPNIVTVLLFTEYSKVLEIDRDRNLITG